MSPIISISFLQETVLGFAKNVGRCGVVPEMWAQDLSSDGQVS